MGRQRLVVPVEVARIEEQMRTWRESRPRGTRIPEQIWEEAISLADRYGACRVARGVGLGYASLRARMRAVGGGVDRKPTEAMPAFLDLGFSMVSGQAELEVRTRDGAILKLRMPLGGSDVGPLVAAFLRVST